MQWRTDKEKKISKELASVQKELHREESSLKNLPNEFNEAKGKMLSYRSISKLQQQRLYISTIEEKIKAKEHVIEKINKRIEKTRQELLAAQKDRRIIEKLKEEDFIDYKKNLASISQKELDEAAILRYK